MPECRVLPAPIALRDSGGVQYLTGRAVKYNSESDILFDYFVEIIAPGAFDESLRGPIDVYASVDHNPSRLLGRKSSDTLKLITDSEGIRIEVPVPNYTYAQDLVVAIRRGDLKGMSFIFDVIDDEWTQRGGMPLRTIKKADLYEVAFVFFPAYPQTAAGLRSL